MYLTKPTADFKDPPEGTHPARCYRVIDLGTQEVDFQGQIKHQRKVLVSWELQCEERMDDGRPFSIGKKYTDEELDAFWNQCRSLKDFLDARHFKSYDVLKKRFEYVTNAGAAPVSAGIREEKAPVVKSEEPRKMKSSVEADADAEEPEDTEEYFQGLVNKD